MAGMCFFISGLFIQVLTETLGNDIIYLYLCCPIMLWDCALAIGFVVLPERVFSRHQVFNFRIFVKKYLI